MPSGEIFAVDFGLKKEEDKSISLEQFGNNSASIFFVTDSEFDISDHLSRFAQQDCPYGNPCFQTPEILAHFLANGNPNDVEPLFDPFLAVLAEINQGERWGLFVRAEFVNLSIKLGFTM